MSRAAPSGAVSVAGAAWCPVGKRPLSSGPLEVLGGPARCQDSYQDWVALYCWAPFHAALMAAPEGSRCRWEQIGRWVLLRCRGLAPSSARVGLTPPRVLGVLRRPAALTASLPSPQRLQRALRLHRAAGPALFLPLAQHRPRCLLPAGPRRIFQQLQQDGAPWERGAAPRAGCCCGGGAGLPRPPRSRLHRPQSLEGGSEPGGQRHSPECPSGHAGLRASPGGSTEGAKGERGGGSGGPVPWGEAGTGGPTACPPP